MNYCFKIIAISFVVLIASFSVLEAKKLSKNISISIGYESGTDSLKAMSLAENIERELSLSGYSGQLKIVEKSAPTDSSEFRAYIEVTKSSWETGRAFSIPYIMNRYKRIFWVESILDIPSAGKKKTRFYKSFAVKQSCGVQAQFLTNDKYDPDLFPDQNEKIRMEDAGYQKLAKELAKGLSENLK